MQDQSDKIITASRMHTDNIKIAFNVFLWTILAAVLNFIIFISITAFFSGIFTKAIGHQVYENTESGSRKLVTEIYYDKTTTATTVTTQSGTSAASETSAAASSGTETSKSDTTFTVPISSPMSAGASIASTILSQIFMLLLLVSIVYGRLWERGDKDNNSVHFNRMEEDKLRGLKIGVMAAIPSFVFYIFLILSKLGIISPDYIILYRFFNDSFFPILNQLFRQNDITQASWLAVFAVLLTLFVVPVTCYVGYLLGYKQISISEKIIYVDPKKRKRRR